MRSATVKAIVLLPNVTGPLYLAQTAGRRATPRARVQHRAPEGRSAVCVTTLWEEPESEIFWRYEFFATDRDEPDPTPVPLPNDAERHQSTEASRAQPIVQKITCSIILRIAGGAGGNLPFVDSPRKSTLELRRVLLKANVCRRQWGLVETHAHRHAQYRLYGAAA
jgi:hypothetical protein